MSKQRQRRRRFWRRLQSLLWTAIFLLVVGAAVITGLGRLLAPYADHLRPHVNAYLSDQLGVEVHIDELAAGWRGWQPHLALQDVSVGDGIDALQLEQVRLQFDPVTWVRPGRNSIRVEIIGAELALSRSEEGPWRLMGQGLRGDTDRSERQSQNVTALLRNADVQLVDARIHLNDQQSDYMGTVALPRVSIAQVPEAAGQTEYDRGNSGGDSRFQLIGRVRPDAEQDAEAIIRLQLYADAELRSLQGYFIAEHQALEPWLALLPNTMSDRVSKPVAADTELWFDWQQNQILNITGHAQLSGENTGESNSVFMAADVNAEFNNENWALSLDNLAFERDSLSSTWVELGSNNHAGWSVAAGDLSLSVLQGWYAWLLPEAEQPVGLQGDLHNLAVALDEQGRVLLAQVDSEETYLDLRPIEDRDNHDAVLCGPLQLSINMQSQLGVANINSHQGLCEVPGVTKAPFPLEHLQWGVQLEQSVNDWYMHWLPGRWESGDFNAQLGGSAALIEGRLWLDMHVAIDRVLASLVKGYLPAQEEPKGARLWISQAMQGGYWRDVRGSIRGFADDWPFVPEKGQFSASVKLDDVVLDFARNWPSAHEVNATVHVFTDRVVAKGATGVLSGVPVHNLDVTISDMVKHPLLDLNADMHTDTNSVLDLLAIMPLGGTRGLAERDFNLEGPVDVHASLGLDLKERSRLVYADGVAQLQDVVGHASLLTLTDIQGELKFNEVGVLDSQLQAQWGEHSSNLSWVRTPSGPEIHLDGYYPGTHVLATALPDYPYAQHLIAGESDWFVRLLIARDVPRVILSSDLYGTELRLPAPLEKLSEGSKPLFIDWELAGGADSNIAITLGEELQLRLKQDDDNRIVGATASFRLPGDSIMVEPMAFAGKLLVEGETTIFDPLGWVTVATNVLTDDNKSLDNKSSSATDLQPEMHLQTAQLLVDRRLMGATYMDYTELMAESGSTDQQPQRLLTMDGENVVGEVRFGIEDEAWVIDTNLQRLNIPKPIIAGSGATGHEMLIDDKPPAEDNTRIDWLTLHLICDDMTWQGIPMGQTRIEVLPRVDGMVIDTLEARSDVMTVTGSGGWRRTEYGVHSSLNLRLDADDAGDLLSDLGYERLVEESQITIALDVNWPGSLGELNLKRLSGTLSLEAGSGVIPKAAPGAGRVLGLISLQALPRRLFLDFSDVFAEGLDFDSGNGILEFSDGIAHTEGIVIDASAAEIVITGDTDLVRGEYDQLITVTPGLGVTLPVLGAIAGGPIGIGAGLALQGIFGSSLSGLAEIKYAVTGPWDKVELRALADSPTVNQVPAESISPELRELPDQ